ncbi:hypothetical protein CVS47_02011 [Microbacterium lemovicicum]|uniref:CMD domain protein n=1 Tax=Microbacterium lemovicicum TaxID=1072463 RepID=A0A3S9WBD4_9MICO|nr:CMD domain protein [Microbacterium lemovicicum]AZS37375.1 hypothetical protein CVS47_02011 [Microbacterium lemovicicum]
MTPPTDVLDELAGVRADGTIDVLRRRRPVTREQLQASHDALFEPVDDTHLAVAERALVAAFATRLTADDATAAWHARHAVEVAGAERAAIVLAEAAGAAASGPYGAYREEGLREESTDGPRYRPSAEVAEQLGERLAAALVHAHLLTFRPREADDTALAELRSAGWSVDGIVTLSQLIAFLAFQQRVAHGLRVLADTDRQDAA